MTTFPQAVADTVGLSESQARQELTALTTGVMAFRVRSSLADPADSWEADLADLELYTAPNEALRYRIEVGLIDASEQIVLVERIASGRILERTLVAGPDSAVVRVRGLDAMDTALRTQRRIRYVPEPPPQTLEDDGEDSTTETKVGHWTARGVAQDLLAGTGLTLFWGVRDYTFHDTFNGVGSVYDLIRQLVEPWNLSTLGVDIYVTGSVLNVRQRVASPTATTTMTVAASRLVNPAAGPRQRLPLIGVVELEGRLAPGGDDPGGAEFPPGDPPPVEGSTSVVPFSRSIERNGIIITVVEGSNTYRMPDRLLTKTIERIHERNPAGLLTLQKESVTDTTFEDSRYGPGGPINQPLPLSAVTSIQTRVASATGDTTVMAETDREEITWKYDAHRFLTAKVTTKRTRQQGTIIWKETERLTETWEDKLAGWVEVTTTRTTFDADGVATNTKVIGRQDAAGFRPGGVRPPLRLRGGLSGEPGIDDASLRPIRLTATVSSDATAIPVRYSNPNLTATDLQYILDQLEAASGLYESRISGSGPAMPWMVKGTVLDLTSFLGPDGVTEIPLEPALVTRADLDYDEVGVGSVGAIEGVFYTVS